MSTKKFLPWVEKYRPTNPDEIVHHQSIVTMMVSMLRKGQMPNILMYGPCGTGKTSAVWASIKEVYGKTQEQTRFWIKKITTGEKPDDEAIGGIRAFCHMAPPTESHLPKVIVLDEIDNSTLEFQQRLCMAMDENNKYARFILICNNRHQLAHALTGRCLNLRVPPLSNESIEDRLNLVIRSEWSNNDTINVSNTVDGIRWSGWGSHHGDMRHHINMLQSLYHSRLTPCSRSLEQLSGKPSKEKTMEFLTEIASQPTSAHAIVKGREWMRHHSEFAVTDLLECCTAALSNIMSCETAVSLDELAQTLSKNNNRYTYRTSLVNYLILLLYREKDSIFIVCSKDKNLS
uniref:Replication factor C clamp loader n=1 Tax=Clandestinovirus TaxID=2831644 RepID=A0A8F8PK24_9VIRU|nr:replication factor C clamp loader [Clandestinovirus]